MAVSAGQGVAVLSRAMARFRDKKAGRDMVRDMIGGLSDECRG